jgi:hypothetical protein
MLTSKVLACAAAKGSPHAQKKKRTRMIFSGRAAAAKANILFDTGASANFVCYDCAWLKSNRTLDSYL